jgi:hypothetical protein
MNVFQQSQPLKGASEFSKTAQTNFFEPLLGDVNSDGIFINAVLKKTKGS